MKRVEGQNPWMDDSRGSETQGEGKSQEASAPYPPASCNEEWKRRKRKDQDGHCNFI